MNRAWHAGTLLAVITALSLIASADMGWSAAVPHKWEDYSTPFKTRLKGVSVENPGVVLLTLPASVIENKQVELTVFSSSFGGYGSYAYPVLLQVNDSRPQPLKVGPGLKVILERKMLKPGINFGLQNLTEIGEGVCVISASRDREFSQEGREWGGGHGVFSYYLIAGLKGAADFDKSGSVSVGEITVYVSQEVRRATRNSQNPIVAGRFDPSLVIGR